MKSKVIKMPDTNKKYEVSWTIRFYHHVKASNPKEAIAISDDMGDQETLTRGTEKKVKLMK
jgi:hypothetical protein